MLGKTNITTLSEGAIVTEIEDYNWIQMQAGIAGNFVKAIYKNNYLVAVTADGMVVYTTDGEVWQTSSIEYDNCKINDIDWDGTRFILVGKYIDESGNEKGLILVTTNFVTFTKIEIPDGHLDFEYKLVFPENGMYMLISRSLSLGTCLRYTDFLTTKTVQIITDSGYTISDIYAAKNTECVLVYAHCYSSSRAQFHFLYKIVDGSSQYVKRYDDISNKTGNDYSKKAVTVFECKDTLYAMGLLSLINYNIEKVTSGNEVMTMCTGQNFMFVDGVYFNECQLFINSHEMLVVKKGESIADKTVDDLIEIAPELTMNCITKAFGQLYIFGNQGIILKSSVETNNEGVVIVQTLSAKKALADAKQYTDERCADLEAMIVALEAALKTE